MATTSTTLVECPGSQDGLHFATHWYRIPHIQEFRICTYCFQSKIASSCLAGFFERFLYSPLPNEQVPCNFNTGKAHQLFDYAQQTGDLEPLFTYAARRSLIPTCPGKQGTSGGQGLNWFGIREIPDFMACEACFEEHISVTNFNQNFIPYPRQHGPNDTWSCDIANSFIKRCLEQYSITRDWSSFVNASQHRLDLPNCGPDPSRRRRWYVPTRAPQATICETCFFDEIMLLHNEVADKFTELLVSNQNLMPICVMNKFSVQLATNKLLEVDFEKWHHTIYRILNAPVCGAPVNDAEFYTIMNPRAYAATDYGLCEACFIGCIQPANLAHLFRKQRFPGQAVCEFSLLNTRFIRSFKRLTETMMTRDATSLIDYAIRAQQIVPCKRDQGNSENVYWWGTDDFIFCAECYDELGKDSIFETMFNHRGTFDARPEARCDMWSNEVRREYVESCTRGDLDGFVKFIRDWQARQMQTQHSQSTQMIPQITYASFDSTQTDRSQAVVSKKAKFGKFCKVLGATAGVMLAAAPFLTAANSDSWGTDDYSYDSGYSSYDDTSCSEDTQDDEMFTANGTTSDGHSMMDIFNEGVTGIEQNYQNKVSAAQQSTATTSTSGSSFATLSGQSFAQHQMNMGMLQMNASSFGMHNAAMSGINDYGSSYNSAYDSTYQSYSGGYNAGMNNMVTGMAMSNFSRR